VEKLGETRFMVWWFDVMNKIFIKNEITLGKTCQMAIIKLAF
jgi:hypothetical protein